jgi:hypothetical protein
MAEHAEVFISGTTRDLASYRREVKDALLSLQIFPIEESSFTLAKVCGWISAVVNEFIRAECQCLYHFTIYALL